MKPYLDLLRFVLENGETRQNRTGVDTISVFGTQTKYDLRFGFPLLTTKKIHFANVLRELLWFLRGSTNIHQGLSEHTNIWNPWARENGDLGPIYGYQWTHWEKYDWNETKQSYVKGYLNQIQQVIDTIKNNPNDRRILVSAWNVADLPKMALPPCHVLFQFYVINGRLDCQLYQRSADLPIGVPYNIASYATLLSMIAQECALTPGIFTHTLGDAHIYVNQIEGVKTQITRNPLPLPSLKIEKKPFWELQFEDFAVVDYAPHPFIKFPVAV